MLCEMCGNDVPLTSPVRIEGSVLSLCPSCSRFGVALAPVPEAEKPSAPALRGNPAAAERVAARGRRMQERDLFAELPEMELAEDWFKRIRLAREKRNWTPEEFGKHLNEKKSVVLKIESGNFRPPDPTIRKIEQLLKIRLRASREPAA